MAASDRVMCCVWDNLVTFCWMICRWCRGKQLESCLCVAGTCDTSWSCYVTNWQPHLAAVYLHVTYHYAMLLLTVAYQLPVLMTGHQSISHIVMIQSGLCVIASQILKKFMAGIKRIIVNSLKLYRLRTAAANILPGFWLRDLRGSILLLCRV